MTAHLAAALREHFGPDGLRAIGADQGLLRDPGLPAQVGPYFAAPNRGEPSLLGGFASLRGLTAGEAGGCTRIGTDRGAQLYEAPDGSVRAVLLGTSQPEMAVNTSVEAFASGLLLLDRMLPAVADPDAVEQSFASYLVLRRELMVLDPAAFAERESWWPRVLDDLRRPLNTDSSAALEYNDGNGDKQVVTATGGPGDPHPEEIAWYRLEAAGVSPEQVTRVYCELQPCLMPGHYCALWMAEVFPTAEFTHRYDYGQTAASREAGIKELMTGLAEL
jgi:hypothetical protein